MIVSARDFDKTFTLLNPVVDQSGLSRGQKKVTYVDSGEFWARLQYREETRKTVDGVERIIQRPVFTTHYDDRIDTNKRLRFNNRVYRIDSAIPSDNGRYTIIRAFIDDKN